MWSGKPTASEARMPDPTQKPDLSVALGPLRLKNPLLTGSGTFTLDFAHFFNPSILGGVVPKSVTLHPRPGNPPPRVAEVVGGMLNAIGLENPGLDLFEKEVLPAYEALGIPLIVNIAGERARDYIQVAERLAARPKVDGLEINLSCPNVEKGGRVIASDVKLVEEILGGIRKVTKKFLLAKLSPNVTDIAEPARAAVGAGADGLTLINTLVGIAVDWKRRRPILANVTGGFSGPAIKPVALRMIHLIRSIFPHLPILGAGGIASATDVLEFLVTGASAVEIGSAAYANPVLHQQILTDLETLLQREGITELQSIVGTLRV